MTLEDKYDRLLEVVKDIAEEGWGTGDEADDLEGFVSGYLEAYSNWCKEVLKEIGEEEDI